MVQMVNKNTLISRFALTVVILRLQGRDCSRTYVRTPYLKKLLSPLHQSLSLYRRGNRGPRWRYCAQGPPLHTFPPLSTSLCVTAGSTVLMVRAAQGGRYSDQHCLEEKTESGRGSETAQLGEAEASAWHPHAPQPPTPGVGVCGGCGHISSVTCRESLLWHAGSTG